MPMTVIHQLKFSIQMLVLHGPTLQCLARTVLLAGELEKIVV